MLGLDAKSVIVTGAGSGIGRATAILLAQAGANVTIADLNQQGMDETLRASEGAPGKILRVRTDVSREEDVERLVGEAVREFGRLDGACNAAGVPQRPLPLHELTMEIWQRCIGINLTGVFLCMKYEIREMLKGGGGSIVNIASVAAVRGGEKSSEYCASKAGIAGLTRGAAHDYGKLGIRVNTVMPGAVDTPMLRGFFDEYKGTDDALKLRSVLGRFAEPSEIGNAIRWLLSPEASFVTGAAFMIDGGDTA